MLRAKDAAGLRGPAGSTATSSPSIPSTLDRGAAIQLVWSLYLKVRQRGIDSVFVAILHEPVECAVEGVLGESLGLHAARNASLRGRPAVGAATVRDVPTRGAARPGTCALSSHGLIET
ncbi:MAG: hypothetical protein MZW92_48720 [Comamonadaceae bacterium]|nr:hypothetical protein [Comamonadaceae bacterium]